MLFHRGQAKCEIELVRGAVAHALDPNRGPVLTHPFEARLVALVDVYIERHEALLGQPCEDFPGALEKRRLLLATVTLHRPLQNGGRCPRSDELSGERSH